ncbi:MAG: AraC family transcriptional regulator [Bacteroidales bacterium]|nr:AraC family transcriptional regulator [Bacteroidales bacterium]
MMFIKKYILKNPLNKYIKCYWVLKVDDGKMIREISPSSNISVCYCIGGKSSFSLLSSDFWNGQPQSVDFLLERLGDAPATASDFIIGPHRNIMMEYSDDGMFTFGIEFKTGLRKVFFGNDITMLSNNVVPLTDNATILSSIKNIVSCCPENRLIDEVDDYLTKTWLPYMQNKDCNSELPLIIDSISANPFEAEVSILSERMYMSERSFQRLFRQHTGLTLRDFIGIKKIDKVLDMMMTHKECSLIEVLEMSGYYDYTHINRDFKIIGGLPASQVFGNIRERILNSPDGYCVNYPEDDVCAVNLLL